jgi:histone chaperone ASF1
MSSELSGETEPRVTVDTVTVLNNPAGATDVMQFEVSYTTIGVFSEDLQFDVRYIVSEDVRFDQVLESVAVGPIEPGSFRFVLQTNPPDWSLIPEEEKVVIALVRLECYYKRQIKATVGLFVNNTYADEALEMDPPVPADLARVTRDIMAEQPRFAVY